ncbi:hypothetical protein CDAR_319921 [Caerostris darwini]|uniref:Uncharacterized protein n=1 Tax=Caerostris darwini TaxID=1538125 RepID=A0AAV4M7L7_9ARAC|nr:hypothetical protein CDAR_319921 [Caerostris darwini]
MYYKCKCLLVKYENKLKRSKVSSVSVDFIRSFSDILKAIDNVNEAVSVPVFLCSVIFILILIMDMCLIFLVSDEIKKPQYQAEMALTIIFPLFSTLSTAIIAGEVPIKMQKIKLEFERIYENELCNSFADGKNLKILKSVLRKKPLEMKACHLVTFSREYLLALFGALFTYGLLFINIHNTENQQACGINKTQSFD